MNIEEIIDQLDKDLQEFSSATPAQRTHLITLAIRRAYIEGQQAGLTKAGEIMLGRLSK